MMPETCWDKRLIIKRQISCILLVSLPTLSAKVLQTETNGLYIKHKEVAHTSQLKIPSFNIALEFRLSDFLFISNGLTKQCNYGDTSSNEDNSFRNHIR